MVFDAYDKLEQELRRGVVVLAVLSQLRTLRYGYELRQSLVDRGVPIEEGTLYRCCAAGGAGRTASEWRTTQGPPRRYYVLSAEGVDLYQRLTATCGPEQGDGPSLGRRTVITADQIIDRYVADVVTLLPRKQRRDVAQELRTLLTDEVDAAASGRPRAGGGARTARQLRPAAEVAARYGSPVTLIDPADTRKFLTLALAGAVLIPFGAVLNNLVNPAQPQRDMQHAIEAAWPTVFTWLGLLVVGFGVAGWTRRQRPDPGGSPADVHRPDQQPGRAAAIAFFLLGTFVLTNTQWLLRKVSGGPRRPGVPSVRLRRRFSPAARANRARNS